MDEPTVISTHEYDITDLNTEKLMLHLDAYDENIVRTDLVFKPQFLYIVI